MALSTNISKETAIFSRIGVNNVASANTRTTLFGTTLAGKSDFTGATILGLGNYSAPITGANVGTGTGALLASADTSGNMAFRRINLAPPLTAVDPAAGILQVTLASATVVGTLNSTGSLTTTRLSVTSGVQCSNLVLNSAATVDANAVTAFVPSVGVDQVWVSAAKGDLVTFNPLNQDALTHPGPTTSGLLLYSTSASATGLQWGPASSSSTQQNINQRFPLTISDALLLVAQGNVLKPLPKDTSTVGQTGPLARCLYLQSAGNSGLSTGARWLDPVDDTVNVTSTPSGLSSNAAGATVVTYQDAGVTINGSLTAAGTVAIGTSAVPSAGPLTLKSTNLYPRNALTYDALSPGGLPTLSIDLGEAVALGQAFRIGGSDAIAPIYSPLVALPTLLQSSWVIQQICTSVSSIGERGASIMAETTGLVIVPASRTTLTDTFGTFDTVSFTLSLQGVSAAVLDDSFPARNDSATGQAIVSIYFTDDNSFNAGVLSWTFARPTATAFVLRYKTPAVVTGNYYMQPTSFLLV